MLAFNVYEQLPPEAVPGTLHQVKLESGKSISVSDFAPNLKLIAQGEAWTAEEAWMKAKELHKHPVLEFPEVRYRQPKEE